MRRACAWMAAAGSVFLSACAHTENGTVASKPPIRVLAVASKAKDHLKMIAAATPILEKMGAENHFTIDVTNDDTVINSENLSHYDVFVMLQEAPFDMRPSEQAALQKFVEEGHGWVGIHAAGLTGKQFLGPNSSTPYWQWFEDFMGGVLYSPHPRYQPGTLIIEDQKSPITKGLPKELHISDEWYEFNKSPRLNPDIHVLASADESSYHQNKPMGDHPLIWTNTRFHRMVYIGVGHSPTLIEDPQYQLLVRNAILWAASK